MKPLGRLLTQILFSCELLCITVDKNYCVRFQTFRMASRFLLRLMAFLFCNYIVYEPPRKQTANKTKTKGATVVEKDPAEEVCPQVAEDNQRYCC